MLRTMVALAVPLAPETCRVHARCWPASAAGDGAAAQRDERVAEQRLAAQQALSAAVDLCGDLLRGLEQCGAPVAAAVLARTATSKPAAPRRQKGRRIDDVVSSAARTVSAVE